MNGYIKLHRKLVNWEWYKDSNTKSLFLHCILMANHKTVKYKGTIIERGSFVTSREDLAFQLNLSVQNIRTSIKKLKSTNDLTIKSTHRGTMVSIVNYDYYQSSEYEDNQPTNQLNNFEATSNQPASNQQVTTNKNDKKEKKDKNIKDIIDFLNQTCSTNFKASTKTTQTLINSRLKEGFTVEDFQKVIRKKFIEWGKDNKMNKYLRPQTLFGNYFEGYLNQKGDEHATSIKDYEDSRFGTYI